MGSMVHCCNADVYHRAWYMLNVKRIQWMDGWMDEDQTYFLMRWKCQTLLKDVLLVWISGVFFQTKRKKSLFCFQQGGSSSFEPVLWVFDFTTAPPSGHNVHSSGEEMGTQQEWCSGNQGPPALGEPALCATLPQAEGPRVFNPHSYHILLERTY